MIAPETAALNAAALKDGVLTWNELQALGVTEAMVRQRVRTGEWQRPHVGVYVLPCARGSALRTTARAALAAAPPGALTSHLLAGHLHRLQGLPELVGPEVSVDRRMGRRSTATLTVHRSEGLHIAQAQGLPATTVARTLADMSGRLTREELVSAADSALKAELVTLEVLKETAARWEGRLGVDLLRLAVGLARWGSDSPLETRIRLILRDGGLPEPDLQMRVTLGGVTYRIDLGWLRWRVGIEADGAGVHSTPEAVFADRFRQNALQNARWQLLRFTWRDATQRPWYILETVRDALREVGAA